MKAVILAGGLGTRLTEETTQRPKPMVEIGGKPIIWHIMKSYYSHGIKDFLICCGYKGYIIKEYFTNYSRHQSDITIEAKSGKIVFHNNKAEDWSITLVDTGTDTMTGGRIASVSQHLEDESAFCMTYGDGLSDVDISKTIEFHNKHGKLATVTAVKPPARFGALNIENSTVTSFEEKPTGQDGLVNGGFFILSPKVIDYISGPGCIWEEEPLNDLASQGELMAYIHNGFWCPMDTVRDKNYLNNLWNRDNAAWKVWND